MLTLDQAEVRRSIKAYKRFNPWGAEVYKRYFKACDRYCELVLLILAAMPIIRVRYEEEGHSFTKDDVFDCIAEHMYRELGLDE